MKIDNGINISQLMEEQGKATLNDPREYQLELYERAKKENTIAVLETGSGKTLIAVLLIRYILDQELEGRAKGELPRTTFFMVGSVICASSKLMSLTGPVQHSSVSADSCTKTQSGPGNCSALR